MIHLCNHRKGRKRAFTSERLGKLIRNYTKLLLIPLVWMRVDQYGSSLWSNNVGSVEKIDTLDRNTIQY